MTLTPQIAIARTDSDDPAFRELVVLLDRDLRERDGEEHSFYAQFNKIDMIRNAVVAYLDGEAVGCGAFKEYQPGPHGSVEIKRMFVKPEQRGKRIAVNILSELEKWASELGYGEFVLETGKKQPEAIRLYERNGYQLIPNYGQYAGVENSVCMKKTIA